MRVISGTARGRRIQAPPGSGTRPITDRAKESIFNMIESLGGVRDKVVADLYAGSGSFGIECLSRGAASVTFVERNRQAARTLTANLETLGLAAGAEVRIGPVERELGRLGPVDRELGRLGPVDIAFCDPPYADDPWLDLLSRLQTDLLVGHAEFEIPLPDGQSVDGSDPNQTSSAAQSPGWEELRRRTYGRSRILIARRRH